MSAAPQILAVITARGGSKGIPGKNIKILGSEPLIAYSIKAAKKSCLLTRTIVSTDDVSIADIAKSFGADVPFIRPSELAQDTTPHLPVLHHALSFAEAEDGHPYDMIVVLQPTSPFRLPEDIDGTIGSLLANPEADSAVSVCEMDSSSHPIKAKKVKNGLVYPYCIEEPEGIRRQDFEVAYKRSSAVYVIRRETLLGNRLYGSKIAAYIVPKERSIDIDTPLDWHVAEYMLANLSEAHSL